MAAFAAKLYTVLTTLGAAILAVESPMATGGEQCTLSARETSTIRGLLSQRNSSCTYNMTVESLLGGI